MLRLPDAGDLAAPAPPPAPPAAPDLGWIGVRPGHPYFVDERGEPWTPIGQNDAVSWPELNGLFRRRDLAAVEQHLRRLKAMGVTCLRLMLEYAQGEHRYLERPAGSFVPNMVRLWDDLFILCERVGLRILLTPYDTFFTWVRWKHHPYNRAKGGPCPDRRQLLTCPATRAAIKARLEFATRRWGASPALFAWDIWNEIHPAHAGNRTEPLAEFVSDVAPFLKALETRLHGRHHPVTASVFGPELIAHPELNDLIFRHPDLDFANIHLYEKGTIDFPRNTVAPAIATGRLMAAALGETRDQRPVFDSEHGPIHAFLDKKIMLPEAFDDEYFRHMQWAHLASGGAGGGMRWPNRHPHRLTPGMRRAQAGLAAFCSHVDWNRFNRRCLNDRIRTDDEGVAMFGCGDGRQSILWLLRSDALARDGTMDPRTEPRAVTLGWAAADGTHRLRFFDTRDGMLIRERLAVAQGGQIRVAAGPVRSDLAILSQLR